MKILKIAFIMCSLIFTIGSSFADAAADIVNFKHCKVFCLQDAASSMPASLFTDVENTGYKQTSDKYPSSVNVFVLSKDGVNYMIDAGNPQPRGSLKRRLEAMRISPDGISAIFITHIHPDHVGGLVWNGKPLFKNATLHIAKLEYEAWKKDENRRNLAQYLKPYEKQLNLFEYGTELPGGLMPIKMSGHTPGHTVFRFEDEKGKYAYFVGDILHAAALQMPHPSFCARYDMNPAEAVASRRAVLKLEKTFLFGAHYPFPGFWEQK